MKLNPITFLFCSCLFFSGCGADGESDPSPTLNPGDDDASPGDVDADGDGLTTAQGDCDDGRADVSPAALELCDNLDNDCDGSVDEDATNTTTWFLDTDNDGYGNSLETTHACQAPEGYASRGGDCDDTAANVRPEADEVCDGLDNDCDGVADGDDLIIIPAWYIDADGDGYGSYDEIVNACPAPDGYVENTLDCDDSLDTVYKDAPELCDELDNDCDDLVDEGINSTYYYDGDGDGYGDASIQTEGCTQPEQYVTDGSDCDDASFETNPATLEVCDELDNNCNGLADEGLARLYYYDNDDDGYGDLAFGVYSCELPIGYAAYPGDCDESDGTIFPGAGDLCGDGIDQDCGGTDCWDGSDCVLQLSSQSTRDACATFTGESTNTRAGTALALNGDIDGDGFDDLVVGDATYSGSWQDEGAVYISYRPHSGTSSLEFADAIIYGGLNNAEAGTSVTIAGDVNGDGYDDVLIGAPGWYTLGVDAGAAFVFYGPLYGTRTLDQADVSVYGETEGVRLGQSVAGLDDVDSDGRADLLIGAPGFDGPAGEEAGAAFLVLADDPYYGSMGTSLASYRFDGEAEGDRLGWSVAAAGDLNADGLSELVLGAPQADSGEAVDAGAVYVIDPQNLSDSVIPLSNPDSYRARYAGESSGDQAGQSVAAAGDVNGDGYDDLLVGAPGWDADAPDSHWMGAAYLVLGGAELSGSSVGLADSAARITGSSDNDLLGESLSGAGDLNGDGFSDVVIGASGFDLQGDPDRYDGAAFVLLGPVEGHLQATDLSIRILGEENERAGLGVAMGGDQDGDGLAEVAVGTPYYDSSNAENAGAVLIFYGTR